MNSLELITRNIEEIIGIDEIRENIPKGLKIYWGIEPTKIPHLGHFIPLLKIRDFLQEKCKVVILLADLHSHLSRGFNDNIQIKIERCESILKEMLRRIDPTILENPNLEFVKGSSFQLERVYQMDLIRLSTLVELKEIKQKGNRVSSIIYPLMQILDEVSLESDIQLGGRDQWDTFMLSRDYTEKLGYKKCSYLVNPLLPSMTNGKMSSSQSRGRLSILDSDEEIKSKITRSKTPLLPFFKHVIFPIFKHVDEYRDFFDFEVDYKDNLIGDTEVKEYLVKCVISLLSPIRAKLKNDGKI